MKISELEKDFYSWSLYDRGLSPVTIRDYKRSLNVFKTDIGDLHIEKITLDYFTEWKKKCMERNVGRYCIAGYIFNLRAFLRYCRLKGFKAINPSDIKPPKFIKKEVIVLSNREVKKFTENIDTNKIEGLRNRTLVETLLGTGMRISEALSLNISDIKNGEAKIIGKGRKPRIIYFSNRALFWIEKYLKTRTDISPALFITHCKEGKRISLGVFQGWIPGYRKQIGMDYKPISAHIFRHTFCTNLLRNGCDITYIQRLAGHEKIDTTIRYYISLDQRAIKEAHQKYLNYDV